MTSRKALIAYTAPFLAFLAFIALNQGLASFAQENAPWWIASSKYWIYPLQTVVCGALLAFFWSSYTFPPLRSWWIGALAGVVVLAIWVSPQAFLGFAPRTDGFNPEALGAEGSIYWLNVLSRFARLVIVIPLLEEIFWRGFLLRYLVKEDFQKVAFGTYTPLSFFAVAGFFMLEHTQPDWVAAFITGVIYNLVAIRTKSLFACVVAHAVTNLGLGFYIMATRQWGFW